MRYLVRSFNNNQIIMVKISPYFTALIDNGCTTSIFSDPTVFTNMEFGSFPISQVEAGRSINASGCGEVYLKTRNGTHIHIQRALYYPDSTASLIAQNDLLSNRRIEGTMYEQRFINETTGNVDIEPVISESGLLLLEVRAVFPKVACETALLAENFETIHE